MDSVRSCGLICVRDQSNIEYCVCKLEYILYKDEKFKYIFTPYYDVIKLLPINIFSGIPGLDLSLKKDVYIRDNILPTFISERVPSNNREDLNELLEEVNMDYMDPIEYLCRSKKQYSGDKLYMIPYKKRKLFKIDEECKKCNYYGIIKLINENIAHGNEVSINNTKLESDQVFDVLSFIYTKSSNLLKIKQKKGIETAKNKGVYKGRKPKYVNELKFLEQLELVNKKETSSKDAAKNLGISIDKYYRYKKTIKNVIH